MRLHSQFVHWLLCRWRPARPRPPFGLRLDAKLRYPPVEGNGWLDPHGRFHAAGQAGHGRIAFEILEPEWYAQQLPYRPDERNYERELEQRRYTKLMVHDFFTGFTPPRFKPTRAQIDVMVDWYLDRGRKLPDWLQAYFTD